MNIEEVSAKRQRMEQAILEQLRRFERETSCAVSSVDLIKTYPIGGPANGEVNGVLITVRI